MQRAIIGYVVKGVMLMDDFRTTFDKYGNPIIIEEEWATKVHFGNDVLLDPFYSITVKATPKEKSLDGFRSKQDFFDATLPEWMRK